MFYHFHLIFFIMIYAYILSYNSYNNMLVGLVSFVVKQLFLINYWILIIAFFFYSWLGYKGISEKGYVHETVNHSVNFVDPETGANTQRIESLWTPLGLKIVKKMYGTNEDLLERYLAKYWWRGLNKTDDIFDSFLRDIKICFVDNQ